MIIETSRYIKDICRHLALNTLLTEVLTLHKGEQIVLCCVSLCCVVLFVVSCRVVLCCVVLCFVVS
jgi:hypothetical protein